MWMMTYNMIKDFGALGVGVVQFIVIIYFGYKLFTNHLKHLKDKLNENIFETKCIKKSIVNIKERVSKIEGKLE